MRATADKPIELEEARRLVLQHVKPLGTDPVLLGEALGRILAEDVESAHPVPGFDNSSMDGFAVRASATGGASPESPATLAVIDESRAGSPADAVLDEGEAIVISTGAVIPDGADAVVRVEDTSPGNDRVEVRVEAEA